MRIVYMGTPEFAVYPLEQLLTSHTVACVITRPDAVRGRGRTLCPSPVKACALEHDIPCIETNRITDDVLNHIKDFAPDCIVVAAYGCILPDELLRCAPFGTLNIHASLLPRWRGAAPIQRAILAGDTHTGVSIMEVAHKLDSGRVCRQASCAIGAQSLDELTCELSQLGARELLCALTDIEHNTVAWQVQDESQVCYAHKVTKAEMLLSPDDDCHTAARKVQASSDAEPCRVEIAGKAVRICKAQVADVVCDEGELRATKRNVYLGCKTLDGEMGSLELLRVKPTGKQEMDASAWLRGLQITSCTWNAIA